MRVDNIDGRTPSVRVQFCHRKRLDMKEKEGLSLCDLLTFLRVIFMFKELLLGSEMEKAEC
jgi:hypothetical protein